MRKSLIFAIMFIAVIAASISAGETTVKGKMYGHWMMDMTDGAESYNDFGMSRAYLTAKSKLSDRTFANITTDLRNINSYDGYSIILKYAYFDWSPTFGQDKLWIRFGLQPTNYVAYANKAWNRRYIGKTISEESGFMTSADLGASFTLRLGQKETTAKIGLAILNGTSYSDVTELNKQKDINLYAVVMPFSSNEDFKDSYFFSQFYLGTQNRVIGVNDDAADYKNQIISMAGLVAYRSLFDIGFDFNFRTYGDGALNDDEKSSAMSFFGTLYFDELAKDNAGLRTLNLFTRIDMYDPDTDADNDGENYFIFGLECNPIKGFKASLNYQSEGFENDAFNSNNYLYLNTMVSF